MPELLARYGVPGSVVASIEDGEVTWTRAYGVANRATDESMRPDMLFEHGSNGKALTAWAVMKLVEQGKVDLDAPVNRYLKRWQVTSTRYDASQVTLRRLLSHTAGFNIHGYVDYSLRRANLPDIVQVLKGMHPVEGLIEMIETGRFSLGRAELVAEPGVGYKYSGAGYTVAQLVIEDVSEEPFASFVQREITDPLGAASIRWAWTGEQVTASPMPYGNEGQALEHRQLTAHAIGSEIATVTDYARFLAAAVPGPRGEPIGRGVLKVESVQEITKVQPGTDGGYGLGYGIAMNLSQPAISHAGSNPGWTAYYFLDTGRRTGFVIASNSSRASSLHTAILRIWSEALYGGSSVRTAAADPRWDAMAVITFGLAGVLAVILLISVAIFVWQIHMNCRMHTHRPAFGVLVSAAPWLLWLLFIWYTIYSPLTLYLPMGFPDLWHSSAVTVLATVLAAWIVYRVAAAFFPKRPPAAPARHPAQKETFQCDGAT